MSDKGDRLSEETYRPEWLKDGVAKATLDFVWSKREELRALGEKLASAKRFYLVGSGGSYAVQYSVRYLAERYSEVPVYQYSGWEFIERVPVGVDKKSVCVFLSHSGMTREVVMALEYAAEKGAVTVGIAQNANSPICKEANHGFSYMGRAVTIGKLSTLYLLFGRILEERGVKIGRRVFQEVERLTDLLPRMIQPAKEKAKPAGFDFKDEDHIFVVGGGINYGLAYQFALCTLMEMCWVYSTPVHFSEFRHGPIEMFTPGSAAVFLRGRRDEDELEEAVIDFSRRNGVHGFICDSLELEVDNILTPFTLFVELEWFSYYLSLARNKDMEKWRYYDKVDF